MEVVRDMDLLDELTTYGDMLSVLLLLHSFRVRILKRTAGGCYNNPNFIKKSSKI